MDFVKAFTYVFKDRRCLIKLAEIGLFIVLCAVPVVGLICLCALLGYLAELIHNVSNDYPRPLPVWDHVGEDIGKGFPILLAIVVYHLPVLVVLTLLYAFRNVIAVSLFGGITFVGILTSGAALHVPLSCICLVAAGDRYGALRRNLGIGFLLPAQQIGAQPANQRRPYAAVVGRVAGCQHCYC